MKILSWNVNGIRAADKKGFFTWFQKESPDILCLQEVKATPDQQMSLTAKDESLSTHSQNLPYLTFIFQTGRKTKNDFSLSLISTMSSSAMRIT